MPLGARSASLAEVLDELTREAAEELTERLGGGDLRCYACGHRCLVREGKRGICKVRFNERGRLLVPAGYVAALACDPTEKKPFFHLLPGSDTLTFGMLGCDLHCNYCQNWLTSQALRDDSAGTAPRGVSAERLVEMARECGARVVGSSYNEPLITAEWAAEVFERAKAAGFRTAFISNGNATPQVLDYLRPSDGLLQDRPEVDERPRVQAVGRRGRQHPRHRADGARARVLGGGRDARRAGLQRLGGMS